MRTSDHGRLRRGRPHPDPPARTRPRTTYPSSDSASRPGRRRPRPHRRCPGFVPRCRRPRRAGPGAIGSGRALSGVDPEGAASRARSQCRPQRVRDRLFLALRRDAELSARGFRIMRVTWQQIETEPAAIRIRLAQTLSRSATTRLQATGIDRTRAGLERARPERRLLVLPVDRTSATADHRQVGRRKFRRRRPRDGSIHVRASHGNVRGLPAHAGDESCPPFEGTRAPDDIKVPSAAGCCSRRASFARRGERGRHKVDVRTGSWIDRWVVPHCGARPLLPRMTPSIRIALDDLGLERVVVIDPGTKRFSLADRVDAVPHDSLVEPGRLFEGEAG
jgi:hypothetical protein